MISTLFFLPLVAGLPAIGSRQENAHHVPLVRRTHYYSDGLVDLDRMASAAEFLKAKYGRKNVDGLGRRASSSSFGTIDLGPDLSYLVPMNFGTPPQTLDFILDTGSTDLWTATTACRDCPPGAHEFDSAKSTTFRATGQVVNLGYGSANASGTFDYDKISMGPYSISDMGFIGVTHVEGTVVQGVGSGIFGLGFQLLSSTRTKPFWQALIDAGELSSPEMSFYIRRNSDKSPGNTDSNPGGTFTLGGRNSSFFQGDVEFHALPTEYPPSFWWQTVTAMTVNGKAIHIGDEGADAIIDTGTSLLGAPPTVARAFWAQIPGASPIGFGYYAFPCNIPAFGATLSFGGTVWPISAKDLNLGPLKGLEDYCQGAVFIYEPDPEDPVRWIIGDTFLKNVYTVFRAGDHPAVGYAKLANGLND